MWTRSSATGLVTKRFVFICTCCSLEKCINLSYAQASCIQSMTLVAFLSTTFSSDPYSQESCFRNLDTWYEDAAVIQPGALQMLQITFIRWTFQNPEVVHRQGEAANMLCSCVFHHSGMTGEGNSLVDLLLRHDFAFHCWHSFHVVISRCLVYCKDESSHNTGSTSYK